LPVNPALSVEGNTTTEERFKNFSSRSIAGQTVLAAANPHQR
jgi:hypothetical protein